MLVGRPARDRDAFTRADAVAAKRYGFEISLSSAYPLRKDWIYEGDPPFAREPGAPRLPNIVVFFTEGLSARLAGPYGSPFPGITPNLDRFAADPRTMVVTNYYNHTFATYRGLHGQLCSLFPKDEGSDAWLEGPENGGVRSYFSLADYLRDLGYETSFLDTHRRGAARVDKMTRRIGFENVWTAEDLSARYLGGAEPLRSDALSDHQLLEALVGFLEERQERRSRVAALLRRPLQHRNPCLPGFGGRRPEVRRRRELQPQHRSQLRRRVRPIPGVLPPLASREGHGRGLHGGPLPLYGEDVHRDHAAVLPRPSRIPVDAIPLIIYSPLHRLPDTFDAEFRTSVDFTPSLIHLLGLPQRPNPFLGRSIFSSRDGHDLGPGIALIGTDLFFVDRNGIARRGRLGEHAREFWKVQRFVRYLADLEESNRIWPGPGAEAFSGRPASEGVRGTGRPAP